MTGEKLNEGIDAVKGINDLSIEIARDFPNTTDKIKKIQKYVYTLTDMLETVFKDMIKMDILLEKGISVD